MFCVCLLLCVRQGYIEAGAEQRLHVIYLPGIPEVFKRQVQLKVAFLPPQDITLTGEGVFPRISLNLPQNLRMKGHARKHMIISLHIVLIALATVTDCIYNRLTTILYINITGRTLCRGQLNLQSETYRAVNKVLAT